MSDKSNWAKNQALTSLLGASKYLALYSSDPTDADVGTEITGGGYARQLVEWTIVADLATNTNTENFPLATANYPAAVTHLGIKDAVTGGNLLYHKAWDASVTILINDIFQVPAGNLDINEA